MVPDPPAEASGAGRALSTLVALLFVSVLGLVVFQALLVQSQNQLDALSTSIDEQAAREKALRLELARAEAPDRITTAAESRLGMVFPDEVAFLEPTADDADAARYDPAMQADPVEVIEQTTPTTQWVPEQTTPTTQWVPEQTTPTTQWVPEQTTPTTQWVPEQTTPTTQWVPQ